LAATKTTVGARLVTLTINNIWCHGWVAVVSLSFRIVALPAVGQNSLDTFGVGTERSGMLNLAPKVRLPKLVRLLVAGLDSGRGLLQSYTYAFAAAEGVSQFRNTDSQCFKIYIKLHQE
jgi:hypothetical protein